ncbi:hypothetical protein TRAPUB_3158 [Trametes pubescens]|uniref:Uncharacterized protein n=1 Tax=Trametes pubescens TaxID=154538 RepID=A0A1M2VE93_TRAPU|nr:hypothetical protein TRAPUB_3158 [Trametes pubescens]
MSGAEFPSDPYSFNSPRLILDTDEAFPLATVITQSDWETRNLEYTFEKQQDGKYTVQMAHSPALNPSCDASVYGRLSASDFPAGVIATFFNADRHKIEYVKGAGEAEGKWLRVTTNGPASHVEPEVLYQTPYNGDKEPYHPVVDYHCVRLSDILTDTAAVDNCGGPAYGRSIVGGQKLSLRLQFPNIPYGARQFNAKHGTGANQRSIIRGEMAHHIAKKMKQFTEEAERKGTPLSRMDGTNVQFDHLVLMSVAFPSKGSIQPEIGVICEQ